jgi:hypothetical protein
VGRRGATHGATAPRRAGPFAEEARLAVARQRAWLPRVPWASSRPYSPARPQNGSSVEAAWAVRKSRVRRASASAVRPPSAGMQARRSCAVGRSEVGSSRGPRLQRLGAAGAPCRGQGAMRARVRAATDRERRQAHLFSPVGCHRREPARRGRARLRKHERQRRGARPIALGEGAAGGDELRPEGLHERGVLR